MALDRTSRIILGDCLEVMKDIEDKSISLVIADIPYNEVNRTSNGLRNLNKGDADIETFPLQPFLTDLLRVCFGSFYIFCGINQVSEIRQLFSSNKLSTRLCIWEKTNPSPMNGKNIWLSGIECCVYAKKPGAVFNENCKNTVWRYPTVRGKRHPTEKNLDLIKYLVSVSSNPGDVVLDPVLGSGTTAVAALNLNRIYIGIEKNPDYYNVALERINAENN